MTDLKRFMAADDTVRGYIYQNGTREDSFFTSPLKGIYYYSPKTPHLNSAYLFLVFCPFILTFVPDGV